MFDDLFVKQHTPNHLASHIEHLAAAGAKLPTSLANRVQHLHHLSQLSQTLLTPILSEPIAMLCQVVYIKDRHLSLGLPSATAVNHVRYLSHECLQHLKTHPAFRSFETMSVILITPQPKVKLPTTQIPKKPLSENTRRTITQTTQLVITNNTLRERLLSLAQSITPVDDPQSNITSSKS